MFPAHQKHGDASIISSENTKPCRSSDQATNTPSAVQPDQTDYQERSKRGDTPTVIAGNLPLAIDENHEGVSPRSTKAGDLHPSLESPLTPKSARLTYPDISGYLDSPYLQVQETISDEVRPEIFVVAKPQPGLLQNCAPEHDGRQGVRTPVTNDQAPDSLELSDQDVKKSSILASDRKDPEEVGCSTPGIRIDAGNQKSPVQSTPIPGWLDTPEYNDGVSTIESVMPSPEPGSDSRADQAATGLSPSPHYESQDAEIRKDHSSDKRVPTLESPWIFGGMPAMRKRLPPTDYNIFSGCSDMYNQPGFLPQNRRKVSTDSVDGSTTTGLCRLSAPFATKDCERCRFFDINLDMAPIGRANVVDHVIHRREERNGKKGLRLVRRIYRIEIEEQLVHESFITYTRSGAPTDLVAEADEHEDEDEVYAHQELLQNGSKKKPRLAMAMSGKLNYLNSN